MVGRNLALNCCAEDWHVVAPTSSALDLTDYGNTKKFISDLKPDVIIHAAGKVGGIQANINNPIEFLDINTSVGRNLIMSAYESKVQNFLNLASTCIYPFAAENPLSEEALLSGQLEPTNEGYALSKIWCLKLCEYINRKEVDLNYKTIVPCNLYGPFDHFGEQKSHLIAAIIKKVHAAKISKSDSVEIWGDGSARREFMYVGDLVSAVWRAVKDMKSFPGIMNCGVGTDLSILEYYKEVAKIIGWNGSFEFNLKKPMGMRQKLSDTSIQERWGWKPTTSLTKGLIQTYNYFKESCCS